MQNNQSSTIKTVREGSTNYQPFTVSFLCTTAIITLASAPAADATHSDRKYSQRQEVYADMGSVRAIGTIVRF